MDDNEEYNYLFKGTEYIVFVYVIYTLKYVHFISI